VPPRGCTGKPIFSCRHRGRARAWYHATRADERRTHDCGRRAGLRLGLAHKLSTISFRNDRAINFYERFADSGAACMQLRCMCPRTAPGGSERSLTARQRVGSALEVLRCRLRAMPMARCYHAVALARYGPNEPLWRARGCWDRPRERAMNITRWLRDIPPLEAVWDRKNARTHRYTFSRGPRARRTARSARAAFGGEK
jgi:hypothetical protein